MVIELGIAYVAGIVTSGLAVAVYKKYLAPEVTTIETDVKSEVTKVETELKPTVTVKSSAAPAASATVAPTTVVTK